ncbi:uncharacterized protein CCR75_008946 [Bremia lactucae]|uniref:Rab3 GTPase-activating protein catalytic subunit n=1 Tax=Bremia lactucae TaxID=4779 RepID=A0A976FQF4_BRELC|nr:hypothetical protein CCR75_008946 [Bremia lactucae]
MQVEQDPSSQFVDFTNATASEQFISDIEQALISWKLTNKGNASLEALGVHGCLCDTGAAVWTKRLQFQPSDAKLLRNYTLSLFVAKHQTEAEAPSDHKKSKRWLQGMEHFTPTMLSVADAKSDFRWGVWKPNDIQIQSDEERRSESHYTSVFDDAESIYSRNMVFQNVHKWFGVDEFLLLSRSPLEFSNETTTMAAINDIETLEGSREKRCDEGGDVMADIQVDLNEAGMMLSALTMALNNCNCTMPAFVPVNEPSRGTWMGSAVPGATGNVSMAFETDSVPEVNPNQSCISGLLDFFRAKLQLSPQFEEACQMEADEAGDIALGILVSASFGYSWNPKDVPREIPTPDKSYLLAWRTIESQLAKNDQHQIEQITTKLFKPNKSIPLFGTCDNPLDGMDLTVIWPQLREGAYVDNVVHSTLDPKSAPQWILTVRFQELVSENERKPQLPLSKQLANLVQVYSNSRELNKDILVSELAPPMPGAFKTYKPLAALTASKLSGANEVPANQASTIIPESIPAARGAAVVLGHAISSIVSAATRKGSDFEEIRRIIAELFGKEQGHANDDSRNVTCGIKVSGDSLLATLPSSILHGAPLGELVSILATRMAQLHSINSMSLLWIEFVKALRERWFQQQLLPLMSRSISGGGDDQNSSSHSLDAIFLLDVDAMQLPAPDFRQCLLHQKLQLLNCCILRQAQDLKSKLKANNDGKTEEQSSRKLVPPDSDVENSSLSDDEFFDSIELGDIPQSSPCQTMRAPEGIRNEASVIVCLHTNEPLLEPVTQSPVPMTEDVAKQQQDLLTRLGVGIESDKLRQQIQSTTLITDMQAFKAANPRCCLADFIRWYSPKDWISFEAPLDPRQNDLPEEGRGNWWFEKHGMLSERMRFGPGHEHIWQQMWESSAPVPACRQKRLFDPVQESEKVYHYMETLSPHELFHQMLAGAISSSVFALETALPVRVSSETLPCVHVALQTLRLRANRAIALLDDALVESQAAFSSASRSKQQLDEGHQQSALHDQQLQVAFEMALDACWKLVRSLDTVEALVTKTLALLHYFPVTIGDQSSLELVNLLLLPILTHSQQVQMSKLLERERLREQVAALVFTNPTSLAENDLVPIPIQREYVLRCICPRPFLREYYEHMARNDDNVKSQPDLELDASPLVVCRMYAAFKKSTVRFALVLAESEF